MLFSFHVFLIKEVIGKLFKNVIFLAFFKLKRMTVKFNNIQNELKKNSRFFGILISTIKLLNDYTIL